MKKYEAGDCTIEALLSEPARYRVPRYQRPYSWSEDQIHDFWEDLLEDQDTNFIGAVILNEEHLQKERVIDIIDGQQRLLTATLFYAALRDIARTYKDAQLTAFAERVQKQRIAHEDKHGQQHYKIVSGDTARDFFERYIQSGDTDVRSADPRAEELLRIRDNYSVLRHRLEAELITCTSNDERLTRLSSFRDRLDEIGLVRIKIQNEIDAYEIFETVNARGVELSVADLLKNLIFRQALGDKRTEAKKVQVKWLDIERAISESDFDVSRFARYFWLSRYGFITEKRLFREVKLRIKDYLDFLNELHAAAEALRRLADPDGDELSEYFGSDSAKIAAALDGLWAMRTKQWYPLLMCVVRNRAAIEQSVVRLFTAIEAFSFRYFFVCKLPANKVEKLVAKKAAEINLACGEPNADKRGKALMRAIDTFIGDLRAIAPSEETFRQLFEALEYKQSGAHRIALKYALNKINSVGGTGELAIDYEQVSIEHLIPQKPSAQWGLTKQDVAPYVNNIGNLTLVSKKINGKIGNRTMADKIKELEKSEIGLTKDVVKQIKESGAAWTENDVLSRARRLAEVAHLTIWKL